MSDGTLRQQGTDACRSYFAELGDDLTELCAQGRGDLVTAALKIQAISQAAQAAGIDDTAGVAAFAEGYVEQANDEIEALRDGLLILLTELDDKRSSFR